MFLCSECPSVHQQNPRQTMMFKLWNQYVARCERRRRGRVKRSTSGAFGIWTIVFCDCGFSEISTVLPGSSQLVLLSCGSARLHGPMGRKAPSERSPTAALGSKQIACMLFNGSRNSDRDERQCTRAYKCHDKASGLTMDWVTKPETQDNTFC